MSAYSHLIRTAQTGTEQERRQAFDELVKHFWGMAVVYATRCTHDEHLAQDIAQEAFITAYLKLDQLQNPTAFPSWLKRIIYTHCDRHWRGLHPTLESIETQLHLTDETTPPEQAAEWGELHQRVHTAINALPEHERAVTEGFYMQGETQQELADRLQVPVTTIKKRLQYARQHLRVLIGELNGALDSAFAGMMSPPQPQRQPLYLYTRPPDDE